VTNCVHVVVAVGIFIAVGCVEPLEFAFKEVDLLSGVFHPIVVAIVLLLIVLALLLSSALQFNVNTTYYTDFCTQYGSQKSSN
jgi:xanthine/uracil permease